MQSIETGTIIEYDLEREVGAIEDKKEQRLIFHGVAGRLVGLKGRDRHIGFSVLVGDPLAPGGERIVKPLPAKVGDEVFFERDTSDPEYVKLWGLSEARRIVLAARSKLLGESYPPRAVTYSQEVYRLPDVPPLARSSSW